MAHQPTKRGFLRRVRNRIANAGINRARTRVLNASNDNKRAWKHWRTADIVTSSGTKSQRYPLYADELKLSRIDRSRTGNRLEKASDRLLVAKKSRHIGVRGLFRRLTARKDVKARMLLRRRNITLKPKK